MSKYFQPPDPYDGWSEDRLKEHCRSLARAYSKYQQIILILVSHHDGMAMLPPEWLADVESLIEAYSDDAQP